MNQLLDTYLLFRLRTKRDPEAFAKLYDRYVQAIYRFVLFRLPSKEMAEDVTAETFLRSWQYLRTNQQVTNFRALLYRIAKNLVADMYRRESANKKSVTFSSKEASTFLFELITDERRGYTFSETRAELGLFLDRMQLLKEEYRDVLSLRMMEQLSFSEIGQVLETTAGNARVMFHRAMKALGRLTEE